MCCIKFFVASAMLAATTTLNVVSARALGFNLTSDSYEQLQSCMHNVKSMPNLDIQQLHGVWYTDTANQANSLVSCAMTRYDALDGDSSKLYVTKYVQFRTGERQLLKPTIGWHLPLTDAIVMVHDGPTARDNVALLTYVLNTDYTNYVVVYTCGVLSGGDVVRTAHIMTRSPQPLPDSWRAAIIDTSLRGADSQLADGQKLVDKQACASVAKSRLAQPFDL